MVNGFIVVLLSGAAIVAAAAWVRRYRILRKRGSERDIVYTNLAHRQQLTHLQDLAPPHVRDRIREFGRNSEVNNVLLGKDIDGTFYVARTGPIGTDEPVLLFEAKRAARIDGLHVELPHRAPAPIWRRLLRLPAPASGTRAPGTHLHWDIRRSRDIDDATMAVAGRLVQSCLDESATHAGLDLGIAVRRSQVLIHCNGPLQLSLAGEFIERARRVRTQILDSLNNAGTTRWNSGRVHNNVDLDAIDRLVKQLSPGERPEQSPHSGALVSLGEVLEIDVSREPSVNR